MARVNTQTQYEVELTESEKRRLSSGNSVVIKLPDGGSIRISAPGGEASAPAREGVEAASDDDVDPGEIEELVQEGQQATPSPTGGDTEETEGNPHGGGMIEIDRSGE